MTYNKTKRILDLTASIIGIVINAFMSLGFFALFSCASCMGEILESVVEEVNNGVATTIGIDIIKTIFVMGMLYCVALIVLNSLACRKPVLEGNQYHKKFGLNLTIAIMTGLLTLLFLTSIKDTFFMFIIYAGALTMKIVAMCMKSEAEEAVMEGEISSIDKTGNEFLSADKKISELQRLKELGAIDEETYNKAVEKINNESK